MSERLTDEVLVELEQIVTQTDSRSRNQRERDALENTLPLLLAEVRASRAAPSAPDSAERHAAESDLRATEARLAAMRAHVEELKIALRIQNDLALSRLAEADAANKIVAADWQEMKTLRAKAHCVVYEFRTDLRSGQWSDALLAAMDDLRAALASSSSAPATEPDAEPVVAPPAEGRRVKARFSGKV